MANDSDVPVYAQTEGAPNTADIDTETLTNSNNKTVHRQRIRIAGENLTDLVEVTDSNPTGAQKALITRDYYGMIIKDILQEIQLRNSFPDADEFITEDYLLKLEELQ